MLDVLARDSVVSAIDTKLGASGLFTRKPAEVVHDIYINLCRYAHSRPGSTNSDIWQSNGPIYVPRAYTEFWVDYCDTIAICYVLLKIGWSKLQLPDDTRPVFAATSSRWHKLGTRVEAEFFTA